MLDGILLWNSHAFEEVFFLFGELQLLLLYRVDLGLGRDPISCVPLLLSAVDSATHVFVLEMGSSLRICELLPWVIPKVNPLIVNQVLSTAVFPFSTSGRCSLFLAIVFLGAV